MFNNNCNMRLCDIRVWLLSLTFCAFFHFIEAPPTVSIEQSSYTVNSGVQVILKCTVTPFPNAPVNYIYWERSAAGSTVKITSTTNTNKYSGSTISTPSLTILSATLSDAGLYQCFAVDCCYTGQSSTTTLNVLSSDTTTIQLGTKETIVPTTICTNGDETITTQKTATDSFATAVEAKSIVTATQSDSISLGCNVDVNSTITSVFWTKTINGTTFDLPVNIEGGTINSEDLVLHDLKWTDAGFYTCHVGTNFGIITAKPIALYIVTDSPMCPCTTDYLKKLIFWQSHIMPNGTREELRIILEPVLNELRQALSINRKNVPSYYRRHNSATNLKVSEKSIGYVGATILAVVFGLFVIIDLSGRKFGGSI